MVYLILRILVVAVMILQIFNRNFENVFLCLLTLVLPTGLEIIFLLFIFAAEILGGIQAYYTRFPHWDTALHTMNGFLMAAIWILDLSIRWKICL